jgi:hypothetical protein
VQDLGQTFTGHVAVTLEGKDGRFGLHPLDSCRHGWGPAVETLQEVNVSERHDVRVTAMTDHAYRLVLQLQLGDDLEEQAPRDRMATPGTEVVLAGEL